MEILIIVIDLNDDTALKQIEEAYTTIGFQCLRITSMKKNVVFIILGLIL